MQKKSAKVYIALISIALITYIAYDFFTNNRIVSEVYAYEGKGTDWEVRSVYTSVHKDKFNHVITIKYIGDQESVLVDEWYLKGTLYATGGGGRLFKKDKERRIPKEIELRFKPQDTQSFTIKWNDQEDSFTINKIESGR